MNGKEERMKENKWVSETREIKISRVSAKRVISEIDGKEFKAEDVYDVIREYFRDCEELKVSWDGERMSVEYKGYSFVKRNRYVKEYSSVIEFASELKNVIESIKRDIKEVDERLNKDRIVIYV